jgi:hypothetical protein
MQDNVRELDYPTILKGRIERGEISWQRAFDWLTGNGMNAKKAKEALGEYVKH